MFLWINSRQLKFFKQSFCLLHNPVDLWISIGKDDNWSFSTSCCFLKAMSSLLDYIQSPHAFFQGQIVSGIIIVTNPLCNPCPVPIPFPYSARTDVWFVNIATWSIVVIESNMFIANIQHIYCPTCMLLLQFEILLWFEKCATRPDKSIQFSKNMTNLSWQCPSPPAASEGPCCRALQHFHTS